MATPKAERKPHMSMATTQRSDAEKQLDAIRRVREQQQTLTKQLTVILTHGELDHLERLLRVGRRLAGLLQQEHGTSDPDHLAAILSTYDAEVFSEPLYRRLATYIIPDEPTT